MSKKVSIAISVVLFIILVVLIVCERKWPEAGTDIVSNMIG